jgi:hypothetical protein
MAHTFCAEDITRKHQCQHARTLRTDAARQSEQDRCNSNAYHGRSHAGLPRNETMRNLPQTCAGITNQAGQRDRHRNQSPLSPGVETWPDCTLATNSTTHNEKGPGRHHARHPRPLPAGRVEARPVRSWRAYGSQESSGRCPPCSPGGYPTPIMSSQ